MPENEYNNPSWKNEFRDKFNNNVTFGRAENAAEKLRDNYLYTVHTDCRIGEASDDCFYGWAEKKKEGCIQHTFLRRMSFDNAAWVSKLLEDMGYQVVVTRDDDWAKVVTEANMAIRYKAEHVH